MPDIILDGVNVAYDVAGSGPPVLLLHGFPETRAMWDQVVPVLAGEFTVVTADLRGYGASAKPEPTEDASNYSFRAMGGDLLGLMTALGFERFHLVGHDRGARVAYRVVRDATDRISSLALMDIVPTDYLVETCDFAMAKSYFHWSFMAQPAPFPERLIGGDPDYYFETCLLGWGGAKLEDFQGLEAYRSAWASREAIAAMCADYRAGVTIDVAHDRDDRGKVLDCPALVLYGADGVVGRSYDVAAVWGERLSDMTCKALPGGHFFVDQHPGETAEAVLEHLRAVNR
ncbi:MAG: alpha/beta hydrolase [Boseongicola sp.]|nr:alpha/beta hydrolase [Boseongicola sp.]